MERKKCTCGRSPSLYCNGWHALTSDQFEQKKLRSTKIGLIDTAEQERIRNQVRLNHKKSASTTFSLDLNHIESLISANFAKG